MCGLEVSLRLVEDVVLVGEGGVLGLESDHHATLVQAVHGWPGLL